MQPTRFFIGFTVLLLFNLGISQTISGSLKSDSDNEEIPFAHFQLVGTSEGFISNVEGEFSFRPSKEASVYRIKVSAIGYASDTLEVKVNTYALLTLQPSLVRLRELVVVPVDYERQLLNRAIDAIPQNYPTNKEKITGEIWEKSYKDSLMTSPYYEAFARIEADKGSYENKTVYGNVRLLEGDMDASSAYDSMNIRIAAGIHNVHRFDFVMQRMGPLKGGSLKEYSFEIVDTLLLDGLLLYDLYFEDKNHFGHLLIADSTYGIYKGTYVQKKDKLDDASFGYSRKYLEFTTEYTLVNGVLRLSYINYRTAFQKNNSDKALYLDNVYSLNQYQEGLDPISFNEQFQFGDILTLNLAPRANSVSPLDSLRITQKVETYQRIGRFFKRLYASYMVDAAPLDINSFDAVVPDLGVGQSYSSRSLVQYRISTEIGYNFRNDLGVGLVSQSFGKSRSFSGLRLRFDRPINANGTIRYSLALTVGYGQTREKLGEFKADQPFKLGGESFGRKATEVFVETRGAELTPGASLLFRTSPRGFLTLQAQYYHQFPTKDGLYFVQDKKEVFAEGYILNSGGSQLIEQALIFGVGYSLKF